MILILFVVLANNLAICSFGRRVVQLWRSSVDLPCRVVGNPVQLNWTNNGKLIDHRSTDDQKELTGKNKTNGHTSLNDLKRSDTGNYTCSVTTGFISDSITYQLIVLGNKLQPKILQFFSNRQFFVSSSSGSSGASCFSNKCATNSNAMESGR